MSAVSLSAVDSPSYESGASSWSSMSIFSNESSRAMNIASPSMVIVAKTDNSRLYIKKSGTVTSDEYGKWIEYQRFKEKK